MGEITRIVLLLLGILIGYTIRQIIAQKNANSIEAKLKAKINKVKEETKKLILEAKEKSSKIIEEAERQVKTQKEQLNRLEERLLQKEELLDKRQIELDEKEKESRQLIEKVQKIKEEIENIEKESLNKLEQIAHLSKEEAREELFRKIEKESKEELLAALKKLENNRKEELENKAKQIIVDAIVRYSRSGFSEVTTTAITLPSEDIKGRVIYFDRFGNAVTNIPNSSVEEGVLEVMGRLLKFFNCYEEGEGVFAIKGSGGFVEISSKMEDVRKLLKIEKGCKVICQKRKR
jgi:ribonuclease Y